MTYKCLKVLESKPSSTFWASLGRSLDKYARDAAKGVSESLVPHASSTEVS